MKRRLRDLLRLVLVLSAIGGVVLVSGIVPIAASGGHWAITRWILDFASSRSVSLHSRGIRVPPLDDPGLVVLGAAVFQSNCVGCHGRPGRGVPPVAAGMTPTPPRLSTAVEDLAAAELFYIVRHGIKFAGMPAWPAPARGDEVWPVVAFLQTLPSCNESAYRELLRPNGSASDPDRSAVAAPELVVAACAVCHGVAGDRPVHRTVPKLAGQKPAYLRRTMNAYRRGDRNSGIMQPIADRLSDRQIDQVVEWYSNQELMEERPEPDAGAKGEDNVRLATEQLGYRIVHQGLPADKVPSCADCHGPLSEARTQPREIYPTLAGQSATYLERQLKLLQRRARGGTPASNLMHPIVGKLTGESISAVAQYYANVHSQPAVPSE